MVRFLLTLTFLSAIFGSSSPATEARISLVHACPSSFKERLVEGNDGALYGFASNTVYRVTLGGSYRVIYHFDGSDSDNITSLVFANDGYLYGTTRGTGFAFADGIVFRLDLAGKLTVLHRFEDPAMDAGVFPSNLVQGPDGAIYGTTYYGGTNHSGTVFQVTVGGAFSTIMDFGAGGSQIYPTTLVVGLDGQLWGTRSDGTLFRLSLNGQISNPVQSGTFPHPPATIIPYLDGNYYIFTEVDGINGRGLAMCRLTPDGQLSTIAEINPSFGSLSATGGRDGYFYLINDRGGPGDYGYASRIDTAGHLEDLGPFGRQFAYPAGVVQNHLGQFYGVTMGIGNRSVVYRLTVPDQERVNLAPLARNDLIAFPEPGASTSIPVLKNDRDIDGDPLTITTVESPAFGSAQVDPNDDRRIVYVAPADSASTLVQDQFRYQIQDGQGHIAWATVLVRKPVSGNFQGLLTDSDPQLNGNLTVSLTKTGAITGRLWMGGLTWALRGMLDGNNRFVDTLKNQNGYEVNLTLELISDADGLRFSATIGYANATRTLDLTMSDRVTAKKIAGQYTVWLPADTSWPNRPAIVPGNGTNTNPTPDPVRNLSGSGFAIMTVSTSGAVRTSGRTPNNRSFTTANYLSSSGDLPFFVATDFDRTVSPRPVQGWLSGKVTFRDVANVSDADGTLRWRIPYRGYSYYVPPLADVSVKFVASKYLVPASGTSPLTGTTFNFTASGGGLSEDRTAALHFTSATELRSPVIDGDTRVLTALNVYNGAVIGAVRFAPNPIDYSFRGVVLQKQNRAVGLFQFQPGTAKTGAVDVREGSTP